MKAQFVSYSATQSFSKLSLDYLSGDSALLPFYDFSPDWDGLEKAIQNRDVTGDRTILYQTLLKQYEGLETSALVLNNIARLKDSNTFTITTGHQLNIFTGPLYFIFKIISAIKLADQLNQKHPNYHFVPLYWMASEDHDFLEINSVQVKDKKLTWEESASGPTGQLCLEGFRKTLQEFKALLGLQDYAPELSLWVEEAYGQHNNLAEATRYLVNKLFQKFGLVIIDPNDIELKKQFIPVIKKELLEQNSVNLVQKSTQDLEKAGYKGQIHAREINLFYIEEQLRERIIFEDGQYKVLHTDLRFNTAEILKIVDEHPERFSPNVVLRPVYQELVLPNIAYFGGAAEVAYWFQLKDVFRFYGVFFPVVLLRNSALLIEERAQHLLKKLQFKDSDIFESEEHLVQKWLSLNESKTGDLQAEKQAFGKIFNQIKNLALEVDPTLAYASEASQVRALKIVNQLEHKIKKGIKRNHAQSLGQINQLKKLLFPNGILQERVANISGYYIKHGPALLDFLHQNFEPIHPQFTLIYTEA